MSIKKNSYKKIPAKIFSISAMFAAFTLVVLYLSYAVPNAKFTFYFLSSVFITGIIIEGMVGMSAIVYAIVSGIALIIMPVSYALPYIIFFGNYGLGKYFLETRVKSKPVCMILKLLYFDIAFAGIYFAVIYTGMLPMAEFYSKLPLWAWALIYQPVFLIFDFLYSKAAVLYAENVRLKLVRSK